MAKPMILDGKSLSKSIEKSIASDVYELNSKNIFPMLAVILIGKDTPSHTYVRMKISASHRVGIKTRPIILESITQGALERLIEELNQDCAIHGILVQLPLPHPLDSQRILEKISPLKDVDGFHPHNIGRMQVGLSSFISATPLGVISLLDHYGIEMLGKNVTVVGASNIVGRPLASLFLNHGATPTICNIHTKNLKQMTLQADILCVGVGKVGLVTQDMVQEGVVIVDIGNNRLESGAIVGDVDVLAYEKSSFYTPVPGGIGPMTIASLLQNVLQAVLRLKN